MNTKGCTKMGQRKVTPLWHMLLTIVLVLSGCGISTQLAQTNVELRNAVDSFDRAIDALARQSADWQVVLQTLEEEVFDDVQSTTRVELNNLMRTGLLSTGGEFRCDAEFLRIRIERDLRRIRNEVAQSLNETGLHIPLLPEIPIEPYICSAVPVAIDMSLPEERRAMLDVYGFDLRSQPITAEVVSVNGTRRNVTGSLGILSDNQMVLDLTTSGASLTENSRQIVFSWDREPFNIIGAQRMMAGQQLVYPVDKPTLLLKKDIRPLLPIWNKEPQCVILVLNPTIDIECDTRTDVVTGDPETFTPPHNKGDKDFHGHGPCVEFGMTLRLDAERTRITATYWMDAWECPDDLCCWDGDKTQAVGSGSVVLYQVTDPGERIIGYNLDSNFSHEYIDDDHADDLFTFAGTKPVEKLIYVGDTKGDEAGTKTQVEIYFRELRVTVEKCDID